MKINANSLRVGNVIEYKNKLCTVLKVSHTQPGKGGAYVQVEMKAMKEAIKFNQRFRSGEYIVKAHLESFEYQYLYTENNSNIILMNLDNYEQISISKDLLGEGIVFLSEGIILNVNFYEDEVISADLPEEIILEILETESVVKAQTATSSYKPAIVSDNVRIMVPPFVKKGDKILVKTFDQSYIERVKE